jgi:ketosteroid isomerase-like protein
MDDVDAIVRLTHDYAMLNDTFQVDELMGLFAEGAFFDMEPVGLRRYEGLDAIRDFFEREARALDHLMHVTTNHRIDVDGDRAQGTAYFLAMGITRKGVRNDAHGYYRDTYVRTSEGWRFASRQSNPLLPFAAIRGSSARDTSSDR